VKTATPEDRDRLLKFVDSIRMEEKLTGDLINAGPDLARDRFYQVSHFGRNFFGKLLSPILVKFQSKDSIYKFV
jgi:hypothetical protein